MPALLQVFAFKLNVRPVVDARGVNAGRESGSRCVKRPSENAT